MNESVESDAFVMPRRNTFSILATGKLVELGQAVGVHRDTQTTNGGCRPDARVLQE
jgi:hypothetical protein